MKIRKPLTVRQRIRWMVLCCALSLLVIILVVAWLFFFPRIPRDIKNEIAAAEQRFQQVRALYPDPTPRPDLKPTSGSLQALADQLFLEIMIEPNELILNSYDREGLMSRLPKARELAGLYDSGVRVSDEAKLKYTLRRGEAIPWLASGIVCDVKKISPNDEYIFGHPWKLGEPDRYRNSAKIENVIAAFKFLRMVDCPTEARKLDALRECFEVDEDASDTLPVIPPQLMALDPDLIARRGPVDWQNHIRLCLDYRHEITVNDTRRLDPRFAFRVGQQQYMRKDLAWYKKAGGFFICVLGGIIFPREEYTRESIRDKIRDQDEILRYAQNYLGKKTNLANPLEFSISSVHTRLIAGALQLRQGTPVPAPEQIGPDSYFYNPAARAPYKMYADRSTSSVTKLHIIWEYPDIYSDDPNQVSEMDLIKIALPANHPGLDKIPTGSPTDYELEEIENQ